MATRIDQDLNHQALYLNAGGFEWRVQANYASGRRHTKISNEWKCKYENLAPVGRISHGLNVPAFCAACLETISGAHALERLNCKAWATKIYITEEYQTLHFD